MLIFFSELLRTSFGLFKVWHWFLHRSWNSIELKDNIIREKKSYICPPQSRSKTLLFFSFFQTQKCSMFRTLTHSHVLTLIENKTLIKRICTQQGSSALNEEIITWYQLNSLHWKPSHVYRKWFYFCSLYKQVMFFYTFQHKYWRHIFVKVQYIVNVYANVSYM